MKLRIIIQSLTQKWTKSFNCISEKNCTEKGAVIGKLQAPVSNYFNRKAKNKKLKLRTRVKVYHLLYSCLPLEFYRFWFRIDNGVSVDFVFFFWILFAFVNIRKFCRPTRWARPVRCTQGRAPVLPKPLESPLPPTALIFHSVRGPPAGYHRLNPKSRRA